MPRPPEDWEDDDDPERYFEPIAPVILNIDELRRRINSLALNPGQSLLLASAKDPPKRWTTCRISNWPAKAPLDMQVLFSICGATKLAIASQAKTEFSLHKPEGWELSIEFLAVIKALLDFDPRIKVEYA